MSVYGSCVTHIQSINVACVCACVKSFFILYITYNYQSRLDISVTRQPRISSHLLANCYLLELRPVIHLILCSKIILIRDQQLKCRLMGSVLSDVVQAWIEEKKGKEENFELLQIIKSSLSFVWPILCSHFSPWGMLCVIVQYRRRMTL